MQLTTTWDTWLKQSPADSSTLGDDQKALVKAGLTLPVLAYRQEQGHICFTIDPKSYDLGSLHPSARNTWWVFEGAVEDLAGFGPKNNPVETSPTQAPTGRSVTIAGLGSRELARPIDGCQHFTWGEATRNGTRLPDNVEQSKGIVRVAKTLDEARALLGGRSITVTSWLRPTAINRAVGGAPNSTHLRGLGVDIAVQGMAPRQVFAVLDPWHGSNGGLAHGVGFTHIDLRPGMRARWRYPGA